MTTGRDEDTGRVDMVRAELHAIKVLLEQRFDSLEQRFDDHRRDEEQLRAETKALEIAFAKHDTVIGQVPANTAMIAELSRSSAESRAKIAALVSLVSLLVSGLVAIAFQLLGQ